MIHYSKETEKNFRSKFLRATLYMEISMKFQSITQAELNSANALSEGKCFWQVLTTFLLIFHLQKKKHVVAKSLCIAFIIESSRSVKTTFSSESSLRAFWSIFNIYTLSASFSTFIKTSVTWMVILIPVNSNIFNRSILNRFEL